MSAAPQYKFTYFDGTGRGEVCRYLFSIAGVEYESVRITIPEWFAADHAKSEYAADKAKRLQFTFRRFILCTRSSIDL